jgi:hypothetical protein
VIARVGGDQRVLATDELARLDHRQQHRLLRSLTRHLGGHNDLLRAVDGGLRCIALGLSCC